MNGNYMGKDYSGITDIFQIMDIPREEWKPMFDLIGIIDRQRSRVIKENTRKK